MQKRLPTGFRLLHAGQGICTARLAPQFVQKRDPSSFGLAHRGQGVVALIAVSAPKDAPS